MYCTMEQAEAYFSDFYGIDSEWEYVDEDVRRNLLNRATLAIDSRFGQSFRGEIFSQEQPNLFPRTEFVDGNGRTIAENTIPVSLVRATAELALLASQDSDIFGADNRTGIQSESVSVGSVSTSTAYANNGSFTDDTGMISVMLDALFTGNSGSSFSFGQSSRG
ncbi:DnaT-like ssDNA-binding protein [Vibrio sp.]|uniref:DnaT-like ssDNA-binding protein n=1 Tax=Vibrio sp. TaxID=678 RepID=UPI00379ADB66